MISVFDNARVGGRVSCLFAALLLSFQLGLVTGCIRGRITVPVEISADTGDLDTAGDSGQETAVFDADPAPAEAPVPEDLSATDDKQEAVSEGYLLSVGDQVSLDVFREPDLSGTFRLESSGVIRHPLFGSVEIAGLTPADAEARITKLLAERYLVNPRVMLRVASSQSHRIVMLGEVRKPGVLPMSFDKPLTLMQAVAEAGGFTDLASINRIKIVRSRNGRQNEMRVRVSRIVDGRDPDILLEPNDIITVPQSLF